MRAVQLTKYGEPEEGLRLAEIAEPDSPKPGQILIRVEYAPINDNDILLARGLYTIRFPGGIRAFSSSHHESTSQGVHQTRRAMRQLEL